MDKRITTPITEEITKDLKAGDYVYITGTIYVARDAAHKRMIEYIIWDHHLQGRDGQSVLPDRQQQAGWTNMHRHF